MLWELFARRQGRGRASGSDSDLWVTIAGSKVLYFRYASSINLLWPLKERSRPWRPFFVRRTPRHASAPNVLVRRGFSASELDVKNAVPIPMDLTTRCFLRSSPSSSLHSPVFPRHLNRDLELYTVAPTYMLAKPALRREI
jgi:hypothetical protein